MQIRKRVGRWSIPILLVASLWGFVHPSEAHAAVPPGARVVVLGSSTAVGYGPTFPWNAWVKRYEAYLKSVGRLDTIINLAVGGYTTFEYLPTNYYSPYRSQRSEWNRAVDVGRNITKALSLNPTHIIINLPTNDSWIGMPAANQMAHYDVILAPAKAANVPVWVTTSQPRDGAAASRALLIQMRDSILSRFRTNAVDFWSGIAKEDGSIRGEYNVDGTHVNDAAHAIFFERVKTALGIGPTLAANPASLGFGDVVLGGSKSIQIAVTNVGTSTEPINSISTRLSQFTAVPSTGSVGPGQSMTVTVTFTPNALASYSDTLTILYNVSRSTLKVPLSGRSPAPVAQISPPLLDFGYVDRAGSRSIQLGITNTSINTMVISSIKKRYAAFTPDKSSLSLPPGGTGTVTVIFSPGNYGGFYDTLSLEGNLASGAAKVFMTGQAPSPLVSISPNIIDFGDVQRFATKSAEVQVKNISSSQIVLDPIVTTDEHCMPTVTSGVLKPSESLTFSVIFNPTNVGTVIDTLMLVTSGSPIPVKVGIRGTSPLPVLTLSTSSLDFPMVNVGDSLTQSIRVYNRSINTLTLAQASSHTPHVSVPWATPLSIPANDSLTLPIRFAPKAGGVLTDTVFVTSDGGVRSIVVSGSAPVQRLYSNPTSVQFGNVKVGQTLWRTVKVIPLIADQVVGVGIDSLVLRSQVFTIARVVGPSVLHNDDTLQIDIGFLPGGLTNYADTLCIYNDLIAPVIRIPLAGVGSTFTHVSASALPLPSRYSLSQNYPNPFNPSTVIEFALPVRSTVQMRVFDVVGREAATLAAGEMPEGYHRVVWEAGKVAAGVYFCRLEATAIDQGSASGGAGSSFTETRKLILLK